MGPLKQAAAVQNTILHKSILDKSEVKYKFYNFDNGILTVSR